MPCYPRPSDKATHRWLRLPLPSWVWDRLEMATELLNQHSLPDDMGTDGSLLSVHEYLQEMCLATCAEMEQAKVAERWKVQVGDFARSWEWRQVCFDQRAYSEMAAWVGAVEEADMVGFVQRVLQQRDALDLPRQENDVKPILRLEGSKNSIAPWVVEHFPKHRLFVDVHGGTASVLGAKDPKTSKLEVYNDRHEGVVNLWRVIRSQHEELVQALLLTPYSRVEWGKAREDIHCPEDPVEWARRVMVASWMGYGGSWQRPTSGFRSGAALLQSRTTPTKDWETVVGRIEAWVERMKPVAIECMNDLDLIDRYDGPDTLFYCDPPYHNTKNKSSYKHAYTQKHHRALAEKLHNIKGKAVISGYESKLYHELYGGWKTSKKETRANRGVARMEWLWMPKDVMAEFHQKQEEKREAEAEQKKKEETEALKELRLF